MISVHMSSLLKKLVNCLLYKYVNVSDMIIVSVYRPPSSHVYKLADELVCR